MLRIDRHQKALVPLEKINLTDARVRERTDLQKMIRQSSVHFFQHMEESLLLIGEEVRPVQDVDDRIDLLAIDQQGSTVVIELKRGNDKLQLLQALSYASMVAQWDPDRIVEEYSKLTQRSEEEAQDELQRFFPDDLDKLNAQQRIILIAEAFDYEVLVTARWLSEKYQVDVRCYRLTLSADGDSEFLTCTCIYPVPELMAHVTRRGRATLTSSKWTDWDTALQTVHNPAIVSFFQRELKAGHENNVARRNISYRLGNQRRFSVSARDRKAYVWQSGRFSEDIGLWSNKFGDQAEVAPVAGERCLRFYLTTEADFEKFSSALATELTGTEFNDA